MPIVTIPNRWTGAPIWTGEAESLGDAAKQAIAADADLTDANLTGANLTGAHLTGANLTDANLDTIRVDIRSILDAAPKEVPGLLAAIREGRVDGSVYSGECACLLGTIANVRGCNYMDLGIAPDGSRPAERWFLAIRQGDTPESSQVAAVTVSWIEAWQAEHTTS